MIRVLLLITCLCLSSAAVTPSPNAMAEEIRAITHDSSFDSNNSNDVQRVLDVLSTIPRFSDIEVHWDPKFGGYRLNWIEILHENPYLLWNGETNHPPRDVFQTTHRVASFAEFSKKLTAVYVYRGTVKEMIEVWHENQWQEVKWTRAVMSDCIRCFPEFLARRRSLLAPSMHADEYIYRSSWPWIEDTRPIKLARLEQDLQRELLRLEQAASNLLAAAASNQFRYVEDDGVKVTRYKNFPLSEEIPLDGKPPKWIARDLRYLRDEQPAQYREQVHIVVPAGAEERDPNYWQQRYERLLLEKQQKAATNSSQAKLKNVNLQQQRVRLAPAPSKTDRAFQKSSSTPTPFD